MKYVIWKDKIYMPSIKVDGLEELQIPLDHLRIQPGTDESPDISLSSLPTVPRVVEIVTALKDTVFETKYTATLDAGQTLLPTADELNSIYDSDIYGLEVRDLQGNTVWLTRNPITDIKDPNYNPDTQPQIAMNENEGVLIIVGTTGVFEEAGFQNGIFLIDQAKNQVPMQIKNLQFIQDKNHVVLEGIVAKTVANTLSSNLTLGNFTGSLISLQYLQSIYATRDEINSRFVTTDGNHTLLTDRVTTSEAAIVLINSTITTLTQSIATNASNIFNNTSDITTNKNDIATNLAAIEANTKLLATHESTLVGYATRIGGLESGKQGSKLSYKAHIGEDVSVEKQIEDNEKAIDDIKNTELPLYVTKLYGTMDSGYNAKTDKDVIVKETLEDLKAKIDRDHADILAALSDKVSSDQLGSHSLIWIPTTDIDGVVDVTGGTVTFPFGDNLKTWMAAQHDADGNLIKFDGIAANITLHDVDTQDKFLGEDGYGNTVASPSPFNGDDKATWLLEEPSLIIKTANTKDKLRLTQISFVIKVETGGNADAQARADILKLQQERQFKTVSITGITATTVDGALTELKDAKDGIIDRIYGISYDSDPTILKTTIQNNLDVTKTINAAKITIGGKEVALKDETIQVIPVDENVATVKSVRAAIDKILGGKTGRQSVIFQHADGTQKDDTFYGYVEIIDPDPVEKTKAYFAESQVLQFTSSDDGQMYLYQEFLNILGWKAWQKTLPSADPRRDGRDDAAIDAMTEATFENLKVFQCRRLYPLKQLDKNVIIDSSDFAWVGTDELNGVLKAFANEFANKANLDLSNVKVPTGNAGKLLRVKSDLSIEYIAEIVAKFKDGKSTIEQTGVGYSTGEADNKFAIKGDVLALQNKHVSGGTLGSTTEVIATENHVESKATAAKTAAITEAKDYTDKHTPTLPVSMTLHFDDGTTQLVKVGE